MNEVETRPAEKVLLGRITGVHGVKGWVKIHSMTDPRDAIFDYQPWLLGQKETAANVFEWQASGKYLLARLKGVANRDDAEELAGLEIAINREDLPELDESEYYWADLVGLKVINRDGQELGSIKEMLATGANDVMVVKGDRERLIPFVMGMYVIQVDIESGLVEVDWDPEF